MDFFLNYLIRGSTCAAPFPVISSALNHFKRNGEKNIRDLYICHECLNGVLFVDSRNLSEFSLLSLFHLFANR